MSSLSLSASEPELPTPQQSLVPALPSAKGPLTYQRLSENNIRLLVVQPGKENTPIQCHLELVAHNNRPLYEALSYTWGSSERPKSITVDSTALSVGWNLWSALRSLRLKTEARTIWVDALCINQDDILERNEQVLVMKRIYQEATKVLVYLGESSEEVDAIFKDSATARLRLSMPWVRSTKFSTQKAKALMTLCYRPYWRRVWIIQEIFSASRLEIICGTNSMEWPYFRDALKEITTDIPSSIQTIDGGLESAVLASTYLEELGRACSSSPAAAIVRLHHGNGGIYSLKELLDLCSTCGSSCKDVRDRIYGLISLSRDVGNQLVPDYSKSLSQLFLDVLVAYLRHSFISTLDERSDWLGFMINLQRLLEDPLWNQDLEAFEPLHRLGRTVQLSTMQTTMKSLWLEKWSSRVAYIGPRITPSDRAASFDYVGADDWRIRRDGPMWRTAVDRLSSRDFHRTEKLNAPYTLNLGDDFFYVSLSIEERNALLRTRSTGRCCTFTTVDGCVGLASHRIQRNDLLCKAIGIDNLFLITRSTSTKNSRGFILVGRALILFPGRLSTLKSGKPFSLLFPSEYIQNLDGSGTN